MMFFVYHLQTYSPKNRAWKKVIDYVEKYKNVLIKDELSLDALKHEIGDTVNRINAEHPNLKRMKCTARTRYSFSIFARYVPFFNLVRRRICWNRKEVRMDNTTVNGIVLDDSISNCLLKLQNNRAASLAELLDDSIGFLLEYSGYFYDNSKTFLDILATLHNARTEFLGLIPNQKGGAQ